MPYALVNGKYPVVRGWLHAPRLGVWTADLDVQADEEIPGPQVTLGIGGDSPTSFFGTILRASKYRGMVPMRIVGGRGGIYGTVKPRFWEGVTLATILQSLGEVPSPRILPDVAGRGLATWCQFAGPAASALTSLLDTLRIPSWRILPNGTLWVGTEPWPTVKPRYDVVYESPERGYASVWPGNYPAISPGVVLDGRYVSRVEYEFHDEKIRSHLWFEGAPS